jgi:hypothetical protein
VDQRRLIYVANYRTSGEALLTPDQVQDQLGKPLGATLTPAADILTQAQQAHSIPVQMQPDNLLRQQFLTLARQVIDRAPAPRK